MGADFPPRSYTFIFPRISEFSKIIMPKGYFPVQISHFNCGAISGDSSLPQKDWEKDKFDLYPSSQNHGSAENGCISNMNVSFHLGSHFPLNHDYGRKGNSNDSWDSLR